MVTSSATRVFHIPVFLGRWLGVCSPNWPSGSLYFKLRLVGGVITSISYLYLFYIIFGDCRLVQFVWSLQTPALHAFFFFVGPTTTFFKSTSTKRSVFELTWLRKHNQLLYFWSMDIQPLHEFDLSKGKKGGSILVDFSREISWQSLIAWNIWFCLQGDENLVFPFSISLTFKP